MNILEQPFILQKIWSYLTPKEVLNLNCALEKRADYYLALNNYLKNPEDDIQFPVFIISYDYERMFYDRCFCPIVGLYQTYEDLRHILSTSVDQSFLKDEYYNYDGEDEMTEEILNIYDELKPINDYQELFKAIDNLPTIYCTKFKVFQGPGALDFHKFVTNY